MVCQKIINLFDNKPNSPTKFWTYSTVSQIKFKTSMIRSGLCDYSDAYILVRGTITVTNTRTAAAPTNRNKKVIFKSCSPFTDCIKEKTIEKEIMLKTLM